MTMMPWGWTFTDTCQWLMIFYLAWELGKLNSKIRNNHDQHNS